MTQPEPAAPSLARTAGESPEESIRHVWEAVGDTGDLVTPDNAQSAPATDGQ